MIEIVSANASEIATVIAHVIVTAIDPETETATAKEIATVIGTGPVPHTDLTRLQLYPDLRRGQGDPHLSCHLECPLGCLQECRPQEWGYPLVSHLDFPPDYLGCLHCRLEWLRHQECSLHHLLMSLSKLKHDKLMHCQR